jgi:thymidylate synthase (FAD)
VEIIRPSYQILFPETSEDVDRMLSRLEYIGRKCYKSEGKITEDSKFDFIKMLRSRGHTAMIEHSHLQVEFVTDRGITHELVRHRIASFAQESTRWCNYGGRGIKVVPPGNIRTHPDSEVWQRWIQAMEEDQAHYEFFLSKGLKPGDARSVLPTCLKTEIVVSTNFTEWRHIFKLRTPLTAHPDMRALMVQLHKEVTDLIPVVFDDIEVS